VSNNSGTCENHFNIFFAFSMRVVPLNTRTDKSRTLWGQFHHTPPPVKYTSPQSSLPTCSLFFPSALSTYCQFLCVECMCSLVCVNLIDPSQEVRHSAYSAAKTENGKQQVPAHLSLPHIEKGTIAHIVLQAHNRQQIQHTKTKCHCVVVPSECVAKIRRFLSYRAQIEYTCPPSQVISKFVYRPST